MLDQYNRKIDYLRVSVTDRCNLRCIYCIPEEGIQLKHHSQILSLEDISRITREAVKMGIRKVRVTGGEPLVRKGVMQLVKYLRDIVGLEELTLTTNGVLLEEMALELYRLGMDRINISLDTLDPEKYRQITRIGDIRRVMKGIEKVNSVGFKNTKINMVLLPGYNEKEVEAMKAFCRENGLNLQRINHYSLFDIRTTASKYYAERPLSCEKCNRIRLTADGMLKSCLFSDQEIPLDLNNIQKSIKNAIASKPRCGTYNLTRGNWQIGG